MEKEPKISDYLLKISGDIVLPQKLEIDHSLTLGIPVDIVKKSLSSNQDGTYRMIYRGRPSGEIVIQTDWGKKILAKTRKSPSKRFRDQLFIVYRERGTEMDFEDWYKLIYDKIMADPHSLLDFLGV